MAPSRDDPSVQTHIQTLQGIISRLANNSAQCKTWCVTLVSALLVLAIDKGETTAIGIAVIPCVLLCFLDTYYLSLERDFRNVFKDFVDKLGMGELTDEAVFKIAPDRGFKHRCNALGNSVASLSIWPFYGALLAVVIILWRLL